MIIDVHTRVWQSPQQLGDDAAARFRRAAADAPWSPPDASAQAMQQAIEQVDYALVLGFTSGLIGGDIPLELIVDRMRQLPEKLLGVAGIDPLADDAFDRFDAAVEAGMVGIVISPAACGFHPMHSRAIQLYEACDQRGMVLVIDPCVDWSPRCVLEFAAPWLLDELARTFPTLSILLSGLGYPWTDQTLTRIGKHVHVYSDIAALTGRPWLLYNALMTARQMGVTDRLLLGSNFPFATPQQVITELYSLNTLTQGTNLPTVKREQLRAIVERNALTCLGITPPSTPTDPGTSPDASRADAASPDGLPTRVPNGASAV